MRAEYGEAAVLSLGLCSCRLRQLEDFVTWPSGSSTGLKSGGMTAGAGGGRGDELTHGAQNRLELGLSHSAVEHTSLDG